MQTLVARRLRFSLRARWPLSTYTFQITTREAVARVAEQLAPKLRGRQLPVTCKR